MSIEAMNWARKVGRAGAELGLLGPGAILLLWSLADRADQDWSCFPSIKHDLAPDSAQSERSIKRHLEVFREYGLVSTESRHNNLGYRIGMRYYLHEEALQYLQKEVAVRRLLTENIDAEQASGENENREILGGAKMSPRLENREIPGSAKMSPRRKKPEIQGDANMALREGLGANHDKKSSGAFKRNARTINHQQQPIPEKVDVVVDPTPKVSVADDPESLLIGWQTGVNNELDLLHRGVDVLALAGMGTMFSQKHSVAVWHEVVNLVLDRTTTAVRNPHQYVLAAFGSSARVLVLEAVKNLEAPAETRQAAFEAPIMVKCEDHSWSGREGAVCPSCRADALVGEPAVEEIVSEPLTEAQIASLPAAYRHMVTPGFQAPEPSTDIYGEGPYEDDEVAPWDREDLVRI